MLLCNSKVINVIFPNIGSMNIYMYFQVGKMFLFVNNQKKSSKMMMNIILRKLPSHHGEVSVMCISYGSKAST